MKDYKKIIVKFKRDLKFLLRTVHKMRTLLEEMEREENVDNVIASNEAMKCPKGRSEL